MLRKALAILSLAILASGQETSVSLGTTDSEYRKLICTFEGVDEQRSRLSGAVFYLDGADVRTNLTTEQYTDGNGEITFTMKPELEGEYTCYAGVSCPGVCRSLAVVATPSANESIPRYYLQRAGESITMTCGTRQGPLASRYTASWFINQTINAELDIDSKERVDVVRDELKDFSLTVSQLSLYDSAEYHCFIKIITIEDNPSDPHRVTNPTVTLQVYQEPVIDFLSTNQTHSTNGTQPSISFTCNATGGPNLQITWNHNDIPIPPDSLDFTSTSQKIGNNRVISELTVTRHRLGNSGEITCEASISYHEALDGVMGESITNSKKISRSLVVLDSSLSPLVFPTTFKDLLIWIDIPEGVKFPANTQFQLKTTPISTTGNVQPIKFTIDDVFFENSRVYGFVPASRLKFTRFSVQVAVVVSNVIGPFSPEDDNITNLHIVDFDATTEGLRNNDDSQLDTILSATIVPVVVLAVLIVLVIFVAVMYKIWWRHKVKVEELRSKEKVEQLNYSDDIFQLVEKRLQEETDKDPPQLDKIDQLDKMVEKILDVRSELVCGESSVSRMNSHQSGYSRATSSTYSRSSSNEMSIQMICQRSSSSRDAHAVLPLEDDITEEEEEGGTEQETDLSERGRGIIREEGAPSSTTVVFRASNKLVECTGEGTIADDGIAEKKNGTAEQKEEAMKRIQSIRDKIKAAQNIDKKSCDIKPAGK